MAEPVLDNPPLEQKDQQPNTSERLDQLVALDQQFRSKGSPDSIPNPETDRKSREEVRRMIEAGEVKTADDFVKASLIFQHGESLGDFSTAFTLSARAVELGKVPAFTILAQAFDRYMVFKQQQQGVSPENIKQRYGTQALMQDGISKYYFLDGLVNPDEKVMFEPLLESFSSKTNEEQAEITSRIITNWQSLSEEKRKRFITKIKQDFSKL